MHLLMTFGAAFRLVALWLALALLLSVSVIQAHPMGFGTAELRLEPGRFTGELVLDSPPKYTEEAPESSQDPAARAARKRELKQQIESGFVLSFDGQTSQTQAKVVALGSGPTAIDVVRVHGEVPENPKQLIISVAYEVGDMGVEVDGPLLDQALRGMVAKQTRSPEILLGPDPGQQPWATVGSLRKDDAKVRADADARPHQANPERGLKPAEPRWSFSFWDYLGLGFRHIVPHGADHMLFVIGLLLTSSLRAGRFNWLKGVALLLSLFTLSHSVTLALGALGVVAVDAEIVEPLIALSIVYVGLEPLLARFKQTGETPEVTRSDVQRRSLVVFAFGMLHGLGFASALSTKGLHSGALVASLLAFNLGVEAGQLCVAALVAVVCFVPRGWAGYFRYVLAPAAIAISMTGVFWFFERVA